MLPKKERITIGPRVANKDKMYQIHEKVQLIFWYSHINELSWDRNIFFPFVDPGKNGQLAMIKTETIENALKNESGWSGGAQDKYG